MALPSSGEITFGDLNNQLRRGTTNGIALNDSQVRGLAGVASGAISMSDLHGKWAGSRIVVGAGTSSQSGMPVYGYKAAGWSGNSQQIGSCEGQYAGSNMDTVVWGHVTNSNQIYLLTSTGQPQPTSRTIKITNDSFAVIGTYTVSEWSDIGSGQWSASVGVATNPFTTTAGAKRWFTW